MIKKKNNQNQQTRPIETGLILRFTGHQKEVCNGLTSYSSFQLAVCVCVCVCPADRKNWIWTRNGQRPRDWRLDLAKSASLEESRNLNRK